MRWVCVHVCAYVCVRVGVFMVGAESWCYWHNFLDGLRGVQKKAFICKM